MCSAITPYTCPPWWSNNSVRSYTHALSFFTECIFLQILFIMKYIIREIVYVEVVGHYVKSNGPRWHEVTHIWKLKISKSDKRGNFTVFFIRSIDLLLMSFWMIECKILDWSIRGEEGWKLIRLTPLSYPHLLKELCIRN